MDQLVSVIIPSYNSEKYLAATLQSVADQTWPEIEVIIIDDGSKDSSADIARRFSGMPCKLLTGDHRGASAARNRGLREAQGDFIQYLDSDDLLHPTKIETQVRMFAALGTSAQILSGAWGHFFDDPAQASFRGDDLWQDLSGVEFLTRAFRNNLMMHPAAWLLRRSLCNKTGEWNEALSLNDDGEYFARIVIAAQHITFCAQAKSYYRAGHAGRLSGSRGAAALTSLLKSFELSSAVLLKAQDTSTTRSACADLFQRFIYTAYPEVPHLVQQAHQYVEQFGGSSLEPPGGPKFQLACRLFGWRAATRLRSLLRAAS